MMSEWLLGRLSGWLSGWVDWCITEWAMRVFLFGLVLVGSMVWVVCWAGRWVATRGLREAFSILYHS